MYIFEGFYFIDLHLYKKRFHRYIRWNRKQRKNQLIGLLDQDSNLNLPIEIVVPMNYPRSTGRIFFFFLSNFISNLIDYLSINTRMKVILINQISIYFYSHSNF